MVMFSMTLMNKIPKNDSHCENQHALQEVDFFFLLFKLLWATEMSRRRDGIWSVRFLAQHAGQGTLTKEKNTIKREKNIS